MPRDVITTSLDLYTDRLVLEVTKLSDGQHIHYRLKTADGQRIGWLSPHFSGPRALPTIVVIDPNGLDHVLWPPSGFAAPQPAHEEPADA